MKATLPQQDPDKIALVDSLAPKELAEIDLYQRREKIYTRQIEGFFQRIRLFTGWPLLLGYFLLPWVQWNGHQAVLFDLPARKFNIFDVTFWPQDLIMLAWLLIIAAVALFLFTTLFGRVWCGYSCPQTVWTSIFMWVEQKTEGSRNQRIRLDQAPWSLQKLSKKTAKHGLWVGFAFLTGFTFVGYFTPITALALDFFALNADSSAYIWIGIFTGLTYLNAGWLREQVCLYMCPYARFQSAMFDRDTLIVTYDTKRGEPRGSRKIDETKPENLGDCIDCQLCVQVCPVGIDIREGLQYECINCALCIDACDSVMEKIGYPPHLISYSTENHMTGKPSHWLRPRTIGYMAILLVMCGLFVGALLMRQTTDLKVIRERSSLFQQRNGNIENVYTLKLGNRDQKAHQYRISIDLPNAHIDGRTLVWVDSGEVLSQPLRLQMPLDKWKSKNVDFSFHACQINPNNTAVPVCAQHETRFTGPTQ